MSEPVLGFRPNPEEAEFIHDIQTQHALTSRSQALKFIVRAYMKLQTPAVNKPVPEHVNTVNKSVNKENVNKSVNTEDRPEGWSLNEYGHGIRQPKELAQGEVCTFCQKTHPVKETGHVDRMCGSTYTPPTRVISKDEMDWWKEKVKNGITMKPAFQRYGG